MLSLYTVLCWWWRPVINHCHGFLLLFFFFLNHLSLTPCDGHSHTLEERGPPMRPSLHLHISHFSIALTFPHLHFLLPWHFFFLLLPLYIKLSLQGASIRSATCLPLVVDFRLWYSATRAAPSGDCPGSPSGRPKCLQSIVSKPHPPAVASTDPVYVFH